MVEHVVTGHLSTHHDPKCLRIALLQIASHGLDVDANLRKGLEGCRTAAAQGADIALFPEVWSIGYTPCPADPTGKADWESRALALDSEFIAAHAELARHLDMAIAVTYQQRAPVGIRNAVSVIDRHGEIRLTYAKVHTCDFGCDSAYEPGDRFDVCDLDTRVGPVKVGAMICFDRQFPESARVLMLKGAELILTPNSCTLEENLLGQFRTRAFENMVALAMTNYPAPFDNGRSTAVSPIVWVPEGEKSQPVLFEANETEGIHVVDFDLQAIREYRARETEGNAYRRPATYSPIVSAEIAAPFVRADYRAATGLESR